MWWNDRLCGSGGSSSCDRALSTLTSPSSPHHPHLGLLLLSPGSSTQAQLRAFSSCLCHAGGMLVSSKLCLTTDTLELWPGLTSALPCHCECAHKLLDVILNYAWAVWLGLAPISLPWFCLLQVLSLGWTWSRSLGLPCSGAVGPGSE